MAAIEHSTEQHERRNAIITRLLAQETILLVITVIAVLVLASANERFLTARNLSREISLIFETALIALPMTLIIITGGIDLSVGSIFGLSAIVLGFLWQDSGWPLEIAIVAALVCGIIGGAVNGFFIVRIGVPPLITTLATLALYRGLALGISEARSARGFPDWFLEIGRGEFLGAPWQIWILLVGIIFTWLLLSRTIFGRSLYAMGNNELASRFAGIPVNRNKWLIYIFSGFASALAAVVFVSRVTTTRSDMGSGMELDAIAAVVLGGTSIFGGSGGIGGTLLGLILIQVLKNGLLLAGVRGDATSILIGLVLIAAILLNNLFQWLQVRLTANK
ncbi:ABC transporter permease [Candidatus Flexifilum breve]|uniref:ABC transporter permease n=1 Tax=Candidatus Flexifilum breve TaxID=3140694 RepID=UPI0031CC6ABE